MDDILSAATGETIPAMSTRYLNRLVIEISSNSFFFC